MFSATKIVGLAAVVALVAGALAVSGTLDIQQEQLPPAATVEERSELVAVRGTRELVETEVDGVCEVRAGIADCRDEVYTERYDWDDDRLDGTLIVRRNHYAISNVPYAASAHTYYLENDGGSWVGRGYGFRAPDTGLPHERATLEGSGEYDGLTAILNFDLTKDPATLVASWEGTGVIVGPGLPEAPEPVTQDLIDEYSK